MNSGENFRRAASTAVRSTFTSSPSLGLWLRLNKSHAAGHQFGDFAAAEIRGQENDGLRKIHAAIVAERQGGLIQHAEQQLPQRVAGFFDFVEKQEAELQLFACGIAPTLPA